MTSLTPEKNRIKLLYLRLTDSAPLIVAQEMGFFRRFGLKVQLQRETSWATLRDKLIGGAADAAAMLAPMPLTLRQALPSCREQLLTGLILNGNGNAITLSRALCQRIAPHAEPADWGRALRDHLHARPAGETPLRLATVFPYSSHTLQLRFWLRAAGLDADRDLQLLILPPAQMVEYLQRGEIDGYCVGEPWNTLAQQQGLGTIATPCNALLPGMPEKVLAVTERWHNTNPGTHLALRAALLLACHWLADPAQRRDAAALLAAGEYLDLPAQAIAPALEANPPWHQFAQLDSDSGCPSAEKAKSLLAMCREFSPVSEGAEGAFREDLYRQTLDFVQRHQ